MKKESWFLGQNDIFCGRNVIIFSVISPIESMDFLNTWLLDMWLNRIRC